MPGIFVCYRRSYEVSHAAGRLRDDLAAEFGDGNVFIDVDSVDPGEDWVEAIDQALSQSQVLLALIDPNWAGDSRLHSEDDVLRRELESALGRDDVLVIPVLINDASAPPTSELPESLRVLARKQAHPLRYTSWRADVQSLLDAVHKQRVASQESITDRRSKPLAGTVYDHTQTSLRNLVTPGVMGAVLIVAISASESATPGSIAAVAGGYLVLLAVFGAVFSRLTVRVVDGLVTLAFGSGWPRRRLKLADVDSVRKVRVRWYNGWGVRRARRRWNLWGLDAVELKLRSGKVFLIGTDEPDKLAVTLSKAIE